MRNIKNSFPKSVRIYFLSYEIRMVLFSCFLGLWQQGVRVDSQQKLRLDFRPSIPNEYLHGRILFNPETASRFQNGKRDFLFINTLTHEI